MYKFFFIGDFLFFEVVDADLHLKPQLKTLPKSFKINLPISEEGVYHLAGVVEL